MQGASNGVPPVTDAQQPVPPLAGQPTPRVGHDEIARHAAHVADEPSLTAGADDARNGGHRNGGAHRSDDHDDEVASAAEFDTGPQSIPRRDPDAVRASISNHFGGVHVGRSHARKTRGTDNE